MTPARSWGSASSGIWARRQPSTVLVRVQMTSNLSSGHCKGGSGVTEGKAATIAGISPCCQEIKVGPGRAMTSVDERLFVTLAEAGVHRDAQSLGEGLHRLAGPLAFTVVVRAGGVDRVGLASPGRGEPCVGAKRSTSRCARFQPTPVNEFLSRFPVGRLPGSSRPAFPRDG